MLRQIYQKLSSKLSTISRSRKLVFLATFLVVCAFLIPKAVFAQTAGAAVADGVGWATSQILGGIFYLIVNIILLPLTKLALSLIVFVLTFVIEIAAYNGYLTATAVNVGWVMIRDITNMVFVVIMLVIAFGTILGSEDYGWKHLLFKMIGMAILVNFSRTICGLVIDAAQVVMITFVNGIAATATSSAINAFGLNDIQSFIPDVNASDINNKQIFVAAASGFFVAVTILVALGMYCGMLVARMVYLWVLIVLSPIAFVLNVLHETHHYAEEWRTEFIKQVITGPILIFFLWLTFVTVGNGAIATEISRHSSTDQIAELNGEASGIGSVLKWNSLANFAIAIGMLFIGLKTAGHLGGVGAHMIEHHALELGTEATMFMTGAHTAKHAGERTLQNAKNAAKGTWSLVNTFRDKKIQDIEKDIDKKLKNAPAPLRWAGSFGVGLGKRVLESGDKAHKRAEDWEKFAEGAHEVHEEVMSTGPETGSKMKLQVQVVEHMLKDRGKEAKDVKAGEEHAELLAGNRILSGIAKQTNAETNEKKVQADLIRKIQQQERDLGVGKEKEKMVLKDDELKSLGMKLHDGKTELEMDQVKEAKDKLGSLVTDGKLSQKDADALKGKLTHRERELEVAELGAQITQLNKADTEKQKLESARATEHESHGDDYIKRAERISDMSANIKQLEEKESVKEQLKALNAIKRLLETDLGRERRDAILTSKAQVENINEKTKLVDSEDSLRARATAYRKGDPSHGVEPDEFRANIFETKADSVEIDALRESMKGRRGLELLSYVEALARDAKNAREAGDDALLKRKLNELFTANNLARGHEEAWVARAADEKVIKGAGIDVSGLTDQEISLSIDLAGNIKNMGLDISEAAELISGKENGFLGKATQPALRERSIVNEKNVAMGITERGDMIVDGATPEGKPVYTINTTAFAPSTDSAQVKGMVKLMNLNTMIHAPVSLRNRADGTITRIDKSELGIMTEKLKNLTTSTAVDRINDRLIDDLNKAKIVSASDKADIKAWYDELHKSMKGSAYDAFKKRTQKLYESVGGNASSTP